MIDVCRYIYIYIYICMHMYTHTHIYIYAPMNSEFLPGSIFLPFHSSCSCLIAVLSCGDMRVYSHFLCVTCTLRKLARQHLCWRSCLTCISRFSLTTCLTMVAPRRERDIYVYIKLNNYIYCIYI